MLPCLPVAFFDDAYEDSLALTIPIFPLPLVCLALAPKLGLTSCNHLTDYSARRFGRECPSHLGQSQMQHWRYEKSCFLSHPPLRTVRVPFKTHRLKPPIAGPFAVVSSSHTIMVSKTHADAPSGGIHNSTLLSSEDSHNLMFLRETNEK